MSITATQIAELLGRPAPTREQSAIIEGPLEPTLVIAGAGSGKTETMAARVVWLIAAGKVSPSQILGLTFTRKAAAELADRVGQRLAQLSRVYPHASFGDLAERPTIATYNSYASSLVTEHGLRLGMEPDSRLLTEASQWQMVAGLVEQWAEDLDTDSADSTVMTAVMNLSNALAEHLLDPEAVARELQVLADHIAELPPGGKRTTHVVDIQALAQSLVVRSRLMSLVQAYRDRKRVTDSVDFADQVLMAARLAHDVPVVAATERSRFSVVLLDEYQDTSYAQIELLAALFGQGHPVTAVGDPHQSIYGWRGASAAGLLRFPERFVCADGSPAQVRQLSTSWRNDQAVLAAANRIAQPLRGASDAVVQLEARPQAGVGAVYASYSATLDEEATAVADFIAARWRPGRHRVTAAVLCRTRAQFVPMEAALRSRGLPVEVVGLGGLLSTPEVTDLVALLECVHDPSRGDSMMRLLTGPLINLGIADIHALAAYAADAVGRPGGSRPVPGNGHDIAEQRSLADVIDALPEAGTAAQNGLALSPAGWQRVHRLSSLLRELRGYTYLSIPEFVRHAERAIGLDIEVQCAGSLGQGAGRGRANLDAFHQVASSFVQSASTPTLGSFLTWLQVAGAKERGLDTPLADPDPDAIQLITVHAAKGLEWDVVAVPGLVDGVFPTISTAGTDGPIHPGWLKDLGSLPYPLRGDASDLPPFDIQAASDGADLNDRRKVFLSASGLHQLAEERRLMYVAVTRARQDVLLAGSWWRDGSKPRPPAIFVTELVDAGLVAAASLVEAPHPDDTNPRTAEPVEGVWPATTVSSYRQGVGHAAGLVRATRHTDIPDSGALVVDGTDVGHVARLLLEERHRARDSHAPLSLPAHVSASTVIRLASDRDEYARNLRRPIPQEPSEFAHRGTQFHAWVERYFTAASLFDHLDADWDDDDPAAADIATLHEAFLASPWAQRTPLAVEVDIETPIGPIMVRSRIDAVFPSPRPDHPDGVVVVDWKTGHPPASAAQRRHREVQLSIYRLAWSRWAGVPLDTVEAAFFYVAQGQTVFPRRLLTAAEIEEVVRG